jgi:hypothetical protein
VEITPNRRYLHFCLVQGVTSDKSTDSILKFINETFHNENEQIMQINPCKYEIVPEFVIDECERLVSEIQLKQPIHNI